MPEVQERESRLKAMVIGGVIDNKDGPMGGFREQEYGGKSALAKQLGYFAVNSEKYFNIYDEKTHGNTLAIFVPLDNYAEWLVDNQPEAAERLGVKRQKKMFGGKGEIQIPWDKDMVAVAFQYWAEKMDPAGRTGILGGSVLMTRENAQKFQEELQQDPRALFNLVRGVNGGPVKKFDGVMNIRVGENVRILPNSHLGGNQTQEIKTAAFPAGYNPNPLL